MERSTRLKFNILAIICIIIFSFSLAPKTLQNDTYYTISIGEHIIQNGIDRVDPFSWHDLKYTYPHWLYDVCTYLIYSARRNDRNLHNHCYIELYFRSFSIHYKYKS